MMTLRTRSWTQRNALAAAEAPVIEMSVIGPKNWGDIIPVKAIQDAIINATKASALGVQADFYVTTKTWRHNVEFTIRALDKYSVHVGTGDTIYGYVTGGTSAHDILPHGKRLRFAVGGFRPKTLPNGRIASYTGARGGKVVFARRVRHPGFSGRHFDKIIARKWKRQYPITMRRAINAAIKSAKKG